MPYNVVTNCVLTAPLLHVNIVSLLCSELSYTQYIVIVILYLCSVYFNKCIIMIIMINIKIVK